jgi:hypothetical protein
LGKLVVCPRVFLCLDIFAFIEKTKNNHQEPSLVVHVCNPSFLEGKRIMSSRSIQAKLVGLYLKNKTKQKKPKARVSTRWQIRSFLHLTP